MVEVMITIICGITAGYAMYKIVDNAFNLDFIPYPYYGLIILSLIINYLTWRGK